MAITIPTVDEFTESTVMLVIREIAEYICGNNGLVAQINNNDITGFTSSYTNNVLKIDATKGDGSTLPVCNVTIEGGSSTGNPYPTGVSGTVGSDGNITFTITMSSGNPLTTTINMNYFASTADLLDLQEQVTGIKPIVTTNLESSPPTITVSVNGTSSTANLPVGGGSSQIWEELNLSSLPTDFAENDIIYGYTKLSVSSKSSSWTSKPVTVDLTTNGTTNRPFTFMLSGSKQNPFTVIENVYSLNGVNILSLYSVGAFSVWNEGGSSSEGMLKFEGVAFNAGGLVKTNTPEIYKDNITQYITKMWRLKSE